MILSDDIQGVLSKKSLEKEELNNLLTANLACTNGGYQER